MKIWLGLLVLFTAAAISCVAAYFSVVGLMALFAASAIPVMIMGGTLEFAKLVGSGWLKLNWDSPSTPRFLKWALTVFVANLMMVTAIGIYGFLMAAHLEQAAPRADLGVQTQQLELQVEQRNQENQRLQQRMNQIDQNISVFLQNDQASRGLRASQSMRQERERLGQQFETNNQTINQLQTQLAPLRLRSNEVEAKLGPVKYFARLLGMPEDSAVQIVICLIMMSFDTLAVALLVAGLQSLRDAFVERKKIEIVEIIPAAGPPLDPEPEPEPEPETPIEEVVADVSDGEPVIVADDEAVAEEIEIEDEIESEETEVAVADEIDVDAEAIARLAGLRPEAEREFIAREIPVLDNTSEPEVQVLDEHVVDSEDMEIEPKDVDRDTLISILERNPGILNEIEEMVEEDVVEELSDREKLIDLLEKNPAIISDMATIIASQITTTNEKPVGDSWLKD